MQLKLCSYALGIQSMEIEDKKLPEDKVQEHECLNNVIHALTVCGILFFSIILIVGLVAAAMYLTTKFRSALYSDRQKNSLSSPKSTPGQKNNLCRTDTLRTSIVRKMSIYGKKLSIKAKKSINENIDAADVYLSLIHI